MGKGGVGAKQGESGLSGQDGDDHRGCIRGEGRRERTGEGVMVRREQMAGGEWSVRRERRRGGAGGGSTIVGPLECK